MTTTQPDSFTREQITEAAQRVYTAALRRAYTEEECGGRLTAADSASLDFAHDEWADALDAYVAARTASVEVAR